MGAEVFAQGFAIGFAIAAPIGPVSLLCIRRTLSQGRLVGLLSGFGAALADALAGGGVALGISLASEALLQHQRWLRFAGGCVLLVVGVYVALRRIGDEQARGGTISWLAALASTFLLTLANPATFLSFAATLTAIGLAGGRDLGLAALVSAGVFSGAMLWWVLLCSSTRRLARGFDEGLLVRANRVAGIVNRGIRDRRAFSERASVAPATPAARPTPPGSKGCS